MEVELKMLTRRLPTTPTEDYLSLNQGNHEGHYPNVRDETRRNEEQEGR